MKKYESPTIEQAGGRGNALEPQLWSYVVYSVVHLMPMPIPIVNVLRGLPTVLAVKY